MIPAQSFLIPTSKDFGQMVRGFRKRRGWTQAQLAQATGLLPKTISALESGTGNVLLGNAMRCLAAMEVDLYAAPRDQRASKMRVKLDTSLLAPPLGSFASGGAADAQPKSPERAARILSDLANAAKREKW
jgi:transcriptional regulator with XRE-family HTH domain